MKLKEVLDKTTQFFKDKHIESARFESEIILAHALKLQRIQIYLKYDQPLSDEEMSACRDLVRRRVQGEPVAYIFGEKDFYGYPFKVNSSVLIPRPETEHVVESALEWADGPDEKFTIVDLGTGSGCIGLTLLKKLTQSQLIAVDISDKALEIAAANAKALEVSDRVRFLKADAGNTEAVIAAVKGFTGAENIQILVSNPPYIGKHDKDIEENVKKFEPDIALFAEQDGLALLQTWSRSYAPYLSDEAIVLMEMGMTQGPAMKSHFQSLGVFQTVDIVKDLAKLDRVIRGVKNG
jgi:release factor glutamine methyltransferase